MGTAVNWDRRGMPTELPPLPGEILSEAVAINDTGEVAGASRDLPDRQQTAVIWDRTGEPTALPPLPGRTQSTAVAINVRGEVLGRSFELNTAVVWDRNGTPAELPPLPGDVQSFPGTAINDRGEVAGTSTDAFFMNTAVVWRPARPGIHKTPTGMPSTAAAAHRASC